MRTISGRRDEVLPAQLLCCFLTLNCPSSSVLLSGRGQPIAAVHPRLSSESERTPDHSCPLSEDRYRPMGCDRDLPPPAARPGPAAADGASQPHRCSCRAHRPSCRSAGQPRPVRQSAAPAARRRTHRAPSRAYRLQLATEQARKLLGSCRRRLSRPPLRSVAAVFCDS